VLLSAASGQMHRPVISMRYSITNGSKNAHSLSDIKPRTNTTLRKEQPRISDQPILETTSFTPPNFLNAALPCNKSQVTLTLSILASFCFNNTRLFS
jgi:hypothetical protein